MPTVTHVFKTYFPQTGGGLEEAIRQCGAYAAANGFDVKVVCVGPADELVTTPDGVSARFSRNARRHHDTHFTPQIQGEKYLAIYRTLLQF